MSVPVIWEFQFPVEAAQEGLDVAQAIRRDLPGFAGYLEHQLARDLDDPGHPIVVSRWSSRQHAEASRAEYARHPNVQRAERLVSEPRRRLVGEAMPHPA